MRMGKNREGLILLVAVLAVLALFGCANSSAGGEGQDATLSSLTVSVGALRPAFHAAITSYEVGIGDGTELTLTPTTTDPNASFEIDPPDSIAEGKNTYTVTVTAADGVTTNVYNIVAIKGNYVDIRSPTAETVLGLPTFTAAGAWYGTVPPIIQASFSGLPRVDAIVNADNTWSATFDASSRANGDHKEIKISAIFGSIHKMKNQTKLIYTGSPSVASNTVDGTISFPVGAPVPVGWNLGFWIYDADSGSDAAEYVDDIPLTEASSYSYRMNGIHSGSHRIWAVVHHPTNWDVATFRTIIAAMRIEGDTTVDIILEGVSP